MHVKNTFQNIRLLFECELVHAVFMEVSLILTLNLLTCGTYKVQPTHDTNVSLQEILDFAGDNSFVQEYTMFKCQGAC